jgi:hypothetical protein
MLNTDAWVLQSRLLTAGVAKSPYVFNMLANGSTSTTFPITRNLVASRQAIILDAAQVRGLLEQALLKAKQAQAATSAAAVAALQYSAITPPVGAVSTLTTFRNCRWNLVRCSSCKC